MSFLKVQNSLSTLFRSFPLHISQYNRDSKILSKSFIVGLLALYKQGSYHHFAILFRFWDILRKEASAHDKISSVSLSHKELHSAVFVTPVARRSQAHAIPCDKELRCKNSILGNDEQ